MLARNAEGLYWMGRYVERTGHLCRLLGEQMETLVDRPIREINFGWSRIYAALRRPPPGPAIGFGGFDDDFALADSFTLADDLTFERSNPDSVWNCFSAGRENARQMRHCITGEMWSCLNLAYLRLRERQIEEIWKTAPEIFYAACRGRSTPSRAWPSGPCIGTIGGAFCRSAGVPSAYSCWSHCCWPTSKESWRPRRPPTTTG